MTTVDGTRSALRFPARLLVLALLVQAWCCGTRDPHRNQEVSLLAIAPRGAVEALLGEVLQRAAAGVGSPLEIAIDPDRSGLAASYGDHRLGVYVGSAAEGGELRVWCWSDRHATDALAVRTALEEVLAEHSVSFAPASEGR